MGSVSEAAPWWSVAVIAGGFLILGGLLTFWYTSVHDKRRLRREDVRRWDDNLRTAAAQYVESIASYIAAGAAYKYASTADLLAFDVDTLGSRADPAVQLTAAKLTGEPRKGKSRAPFHARRSIEQGQCGTANDAIRFVGRVMNPADACPWWECRQARATFTGRTGLA